MAISETIQHLVGRGLGRVVKSWPVSFSEPTHPWVHQWSYGTCRRAMQLNKLANAGELHCRYSLHATATIAVARPRWINVHVMLPPQSARRLQDLKQGWIQRKGLCINHHQPFLMRISL